MAPFLIAWKFAMLILTELNQSNFSLILVSFVVRTSITLWEVHQLLYLDSHSQQYNRLGIILWSNSRKCLLWNYTSWCSWWCSLIVPWHLLNRFSHQRIANINILCLHCYSKKVVQHLLNIYKSLIRPTSTTNSSWFQVQS